MRFTSAVAAVALLFAPAALAQSSITVAYDQTYDNSDQSLSTVSCSDGTYGLETQGYTTFGSLPDFPYIGAAAAVSGWGSAECGTCWELAYDGNTINVLAIDHAGDGFNIALEAMNVLTDNQAEALGRVTATATQVDASVCGIA
ncbi:Cerato-platanin [Daedalea quercina L-15889]|uniref:Cerato-platanin n=1 Tax=Daedalea quercina L-15889 TaxID=1314783 RepID=A0A165KQ71_9APHY|nr:Cerato-platanin [Daedalea quercina L-15889]